MRIISALLLTLALIPLPRSARSQPYGLPKTGQENIYHHPAENDLGDDGAVQAGYPTGSRRNLAFQDNGDGTVTDLASGLMWQKGNSSNQDFAGLSGQMTWEEAFDYVENMNSTSYAGKNDWRLPNIKELASVLNLDTWAPASYSILDGTQASNYWSSTSLQIQGEQKTYCLGFNEAYIRYVHPDSTQKQFVRAVRSYLPGSGTYGYPKSGQNQVFHQGGGYDLGDDGVTQSGYPLTGFSYMTNGDGTVRQAATGLIWQQSDSSSQTFGGFSGPLTWEDSFSYIAQMNAQTFAGYNDWRMPNYLELVSLLDFGYFWPIIMS